MPKHILLGNIPVDVFQKNIKNVHLSVYPPSGRVRISAPKRLKLDTIRVFALSKLDWIKKQQVQLRSQPRDTPREFLDRESHFVWGKRYLLKLVNEKGTPKIELRHSELLMKVPANYTKEKKRALLAAWYRDQLKTQMKPLIEEWEPKLGVKVQKIFVQHMRTRWGTCNHRKRTIRLNTELAKKPLESLEYVLVHEMVHFLEPTHNLHFKSLMGQFMPQWKHYWNRLNQLPVRHEKWVY